LTRCQALSRVADQPSGSPVDLSGLTVREKP
jgi:hypothetical protein